MGRTRAQDEDVDVRMADVAGPLERLGDIPLHRIRMRPLPGTATEEDVVRLNERKVSLFELVEGTLVEKAMGAREALVATCLIITLGEYVRRHKLGKVLGADAMLRLMPGLVRLPDVTFLSWARLPKGEEKKKAAWDVGPDLAVEVLSKSNTRGEIARKLREYFFAECRLAWVINPKTSTADVYTAPDERQRISRTGVLDGGDVVPGFRLVLSELFAEADEEEPSP